MTITTYPYSDIVLFETRFPGSSGFFTGSGVIIGPHTILTATHMVWNGSSAASNVYLYPGYDGSGPNPAGSGSPVSFKTGIEHYYQIPLSNGLINHDDVAFDFAVFDVSATFTSWLSVGALSDTFSSGYVNLSGYPAANPNVVWGHQLDYFNQFISKDSTSGIFDYAGPQPIYGGNSGGPFWVTDANGTPTVVGVVSTSSWEKQLTTADLTTIANWEATDAWSWGNGAHLSIAGSGHFNADSTADLVWQNMDGALGFWLMNGESITSAETTNPGASWHIAAAADFNGDGKSDVLWENTGYSPAIWLMNGTSLSSGGALPNIGPSWHILKTADFNGDGRSDILLDNDAGTPAVWLMNGTSISSGGALPTLGLSWTIDQTGDFNGDGKTDILLSNTAGTPVIWLMDGANIASGAALPTIGPSWNALTAADFNGDGKSDLLLENTGGTPVVWLMNGTSITSGAALPTLGTAWHYLASGDFNGDGKADILWQNDNGATAVWLMNGTSVSTGAILPNTGTSWHVVSVKDFDGDGKADIFWENDGGGTAVWLMNGAQIASGAATTTDTMINTASEQMVAASTAATAVASLDSTGAPSNAAKGAYASAPPDNFQFVFNQNSSSAANADYGPVNEAAQHLNGTSFGDSGAVTYHLAAADLAVQALPETHDFHLI